MPRKKAAPTEALPVTTDDLLKEIAKLKKELTSLAKKKPVKKKVAKKATRKQKVSAEQSPPLQEITKPKPVNRPGSDYLLPAKPEDEKPPERRNRFVDDGTLHEEERIVNNAMLGNQAKPTERRERQENSKVQVSCDDCKKKVMVHAAFAPRRLDPTDKNSAMQMFVCDSCISRKVRR